MKLFSGTHQRGGAGSRHFSYSKSQRLKRWLSVHDLQVGFQLICYQSESSGSSVNESCAQDTEQNAAVIWSVDDCGKIVCVAGSKIDWEMSTTHDGMLASSSSSRRRRSNQKFNHQEFTTEIEKIFVWPKPQQYQKRYKIVKEWIWIVVKWTIQDCVVKADVSKREKSSLFEKFRTTRTKCPRSQNVNSSRSVWERDIHVQQVGAGRDAKVAIWTDLNLWTLSSGTIWWCAVHHSTSQIGRNPRQRTFYRGRVFVKACPMLIARAHACSNCSSCISLSSCSSQRVGAVSLIPSCLGISGHPSGSRSGHPRCTGDRSAGRPWVARSQFNTAVQSSIQQSHGADKSTVDESMLCYDGPKKWRTHWVDARDFQVHVDSDWVGDLLGRMNTTGMIVRRSIEECVSTTSENKITFETNCETNEYFHLFINTEMLVIAARTHVDYVDDGVSFLSQELQERWNTRVWIACSVQWVWKWNKSTIGWTWNERQARRHECETRMTSVWLHDRSRCKPGASYQWGKSWFVNVMTDWKSNSIHRGKKRCPRMNSSI